MVFGFLRNPTREPELAQRRQQLLGGSWYLGLGFTQERFGHWLAIGFAAITTEHHTPGLVIRGESTNTTLQAYLPLKTHQEWSGLYLPQRVRARVRPQLFLSLSLSLYLTTI